MENPVRACTGARDLGGANFLLDVIPYRHSEAAQILGGRSLALCQALALTSENDLGTLYRPGFALVVDAAILPGKPIILGTRLSVEFVVGLLADGWSEADVLRNYPNLVHEDIVACLRYAAEVLRAEKVYPIVTA